MTRVVLVEDHGVARSTARNHVQRVLDQLGARSQLAALRRPGGR
ncbi:hypothetical protein PV646_04970 [Streptomyces sp. ID05-26A]|nr:hypothetical protein [Streptomyces sp. ID05-26A]